MLLAAEWPMKPTGYWEDASTWKDSAPPAAGEAVEITVAAGEDSSVTNALKLRTDLTFALGSLAVRNDGTTKAFVLDGAGRTFLTPDLASDAGVAYATEPLNVRAYGQGVKYTSFRLNGSSTTAGWLRMTNGRVVHFDEAVANGNESLLVDRGTFDFCQPDAVSASAREFEIFGNASNGRIARGNLSLTIRGGGTSVRLPVAYFKDSGITNRFVLTDGATLRAASLCSRYQKGDYTTFEVSGGASLTVDGAIEYGTYPGQSKAYSIHPHLMTIRDSTVTAGGAIYLRGNMTTVISNSVLEAQAKNSLSFGYTALTQTVSIADSALTAGSFDFSSRNADALATTRLERVSFHSTSMAVTFSRGSHALSDCTFACDYAGSASRNINVQRDVEMTMSRCTSADYPLWVGIDQGQASSTEPSRLLVTDGVSSFRSGEFGSYAPAYVTVTNGATLQFTGYGNKTYYKFVALCPRPHNLVREKDATLLLTDGGALVCGLVYGGAGATAKGGTATATVCGDGGTIRFCGGAALESGYDFISGLDCVCATAKGLTLDSNGYDLPVSQAFENAAGEAGLLVKAGGGTISLRGAACTVAKTRVAGGTLRLADSVASFSSALSVDGGTFSLDNGTDDTLTLAGLAVTNGTLRLDPTDAIVVNGPVSFVGLALAFTTAPAQDTPVSVLTVKGSRDLAAEAAWAKAFSTASGDGTYLKFEAVYDSEAGETTYRATRKAEASPITEDANVRWTGTGAWAADANWDGGAKPTAAARALFDSETAGDTVTVASGDTAGALRFTAAQPYVLAGTGPLALAGARGANAIEVTAGAPTVETPIRTAEPIDVAVSAGASLELGGTVTGGSLRKTGTGRLDVTAANAFEGATSLAGGLTRLLGAGTLAATTGTPQNHVDLGTGTLELDATASANFSQTIRLAETTSPNDPIIIHNQGEMATSISEVLVGGSFIKRGAGRLTLGLPDGAYSFPGTNGGKSSTTPSGSLLTYPEDGTKPTVDNSYWGFNVSDGEVVLKKSDQLTVTMGTVRVGLCTTNNEARPALVMDGGNWNVDYCELGYNAGYNYYTPSMPKDSIWIITNGATVLNTTTKIGNSCWARHTGGCPELRVVDGATYHDNSQFQMLPRPDSGAKAVLAVKDATFIYRCWVSSVVEADFDNAVVKPHWSGNAKNPDDAFLQFSDFAHASLAFRNGTTLTTRGIKGKTLAYDVEITFDDATVTLTHDGEAPQGQFTTDFVNPTYYKFVLRGKGLTLPVDSGYYLRTQIPFVGTGALAKTGAGTLDFWDDTYRFTGTFSVEGPVALTNHTASISGARMTGSGTVAGGTFDSLTIVRELNADGSLAADGVLTFDGTTLPAEITVDLGHGRDDPIALPKSLAIPVLTCAGGTVAPLSKCRVTGVDGRRRTGTLTQLGDTVYLTAATTHGVAIVIR